MKIVSVIFQSGNNTSTRYHYAYYGDVDVEIGDVGIANHSEVKVVGVFDPDKVPNEAALATREIKHLFSLKAERAEAARVARIAEIKNTLLSIRQKQEERAELEKIASNDANARKLLDELNTLEQ